VETTLRFHDREREKKTFASQKISFFFGLHQQQQQQQQQQQHQLVTKLRVALMYSCAN